jgi:biotin carboxyl carrier protein
LTTEAGRSTTSPAAICCATPESRTCTLLIRRDFTILLPECVKFQRDILDSGGLRSIAAYEINRKEREGELPLEELERVVELVRGGGVSEISVRHGELEITVKAKEEGEPPHSPSRPAEAEDEAEEKDIHEVCSPVVGTFYRAPAPGEEPYVEVGDEVSEGQTLCIVEAMKLMNEIPSGVSGEVAEVLAEDSEGVQYDQPLFLIRPGA